jgi:hypothetical protein
MLTQIFRNTSVSINGRKSLSPTLSVTFGIGTNHRHFHSCGISLFAHIVAKMSYTSITIVAGHAASALYATSFGPPQIALVIA